MDAVAYRHVLRVLADGDTQAMLHDLSLEGTIPTGSFMGLPVMLDRDAQAWVIPLPFFRVE